MCALVSVPAKEKIQTSATDSSFAKTNFFLEKNKFPKKRRTFRERLCSLIAAQKNISFKNKHYQNENTHLRLKRESKSFLSPFFLKEKDETTNKTKHSFSCQPLPPVSQSRAFWSWTCEQNQKQSQFFALTETFDESLLERSDRRADLHC